MRINCIRTPRDGGRPVAADVDALVDRMLEAAPAGVVETMFLFGSGARGELGPGSDLDFGVTLRGAADGVVKAMRRAAGRRRAVDVERPMTDRMERSGRERQRISYEPADTTSLDRACSMEGILLYAGGRRRGFAGAFSRPERPASAPDPRPERIGSTADGWREAAGDALRASERRAASPKGPTDRHRGAHLAWVAGRCALTSAILRRGTWAPCPKRLVDGLETLAEAGGPVEPADAAAAAVLDRYRARWLFEGDAVPEWEEAVEAAEAAEELLKALNE